MTPEEKQERYRNIQNLFKVAEQKIKEVERLEGSLLIPSVNQLRYVGHHLIKALCSEEEDSFKLEIDKAENHCHRAIYDAHEVGILYFLEKIKVFQENYKNSLTIVREVIPTYVDDLMNADRARKFIDDVDHGSINARDVYYSQSEPYYRKLEEIVQRLNVSEPAIQERVREEDKKEREDLRRFWIQLIVSVASVIVAIIALLKQLGFPAHLSQ
jgi:hypothetical protein